jgi:ubiquinone/menaquinone biosynthesis C-methylase UbiE
MKQAKSQSLAQAENHKPFKGPGMEGWIARWYARTRKNDLEDFRRQAVAVADSLPASAKVLEVAPGPGFFAIELAKLGGFQITALDISRTFVEMASQNAEAAGVKIDFRVGDVAAMPFSGPAFDFIYCAAAFKNFSEPVKALDEMHRVLMPGGRATIMDLRHDLSIEQIEKYVKESGRTRLDAWLTTMTFRHMLIKRAYTADQFRRLAEESAFENCEMTIGDISFEAHFATP